MSDAPDTTPGTPGTPDPAAPPQSAPETFSREYVEELRRENARYRTERNTAAEQARTAAEQEAAKIIAAHESNIARLTDELGESWILAEKIKQSIDAGVPTDKLIAFAGALQGVDEASIKSSALSLKTLFGISDPAPVGVTDPTQGSGQRGLANPAQDPILQALTEAANRRH